MDTNNLWATIRRWLLYTAIAAAVLPMLWLVIRFGDVLLNWSLYSWFFQRIHDVGTLPDAIAGALAVWCVVAVVLVGPSVAFSVFIKRRRRTILITAAALSAWMVGLYLLSLPQQGRLFNPFTKRANFVYVRHPDQALQLLPTGYLIDPDTGIGTQPLTSAIAQEYRRQQAARIQASQEAAQQTRQYATTNERLNQELAACRNAAREPLQRSASTVSARATSPPHQNSTHPAEPPLERTRPTPSEQPSRVAVEEQFPAPRRSASVGQFTFDLQGCRLEDDDVTCEVLATNSGDDREVSVVGIDGDFHGDDGPRMIDDRGNLHFPDGVSTGGPFERIPNVVLVSHVGTLLRLHYPGVKTNPAYLSLVETVAVDYHSSPQKVFRAQFRKVALAK